MNKKANKFSSVAIHATIVIVIAAIVFGAQLFYSEVKETSKQQFISSGNLEIVVLDVGNADSIFIKYADKTMLIDAGENNDEDKIVEYLRRDGVGKLDYVIATHPDADHVGGMDAIVQKFEIDKFYMPILPDEFTPTSATYKSLLTTLDAEETAVYQGVAGEKFDFGGCSVEFLSPQKDFNGSNNDFSIVTLITHGNLKFLFMGDAEESVENALLNSGIDIKADFLKVGHHGSKTSSTAKFLKKVAPRYCAVTCGQNNRYNHPNLEAIKRMESVGAKIFRTDINGDITVVSDGKAIEIRTEK